MRGRVGGGWEREVAVGGERRGQRRTTGACQSVARWAAGVRDDTPAGDEACDRRTLEGSVLHAELTERSPTQRHGMRSAFQLEIVAVEGGRAEQGFDS